MLWKHSTMTHKLSLKQNTTSLSASSSIRSYNQTFPMSTVRIQVSACALSSTLNHIRYRPNYVVSTSRFNNQFSFRVSMSSVPPSEPLEIAVKASITSPNKLGDCKKLNYSLFYLVSALSFFFILFDCD